MSEPSARNTVLVVDDDADARDAVARVLRKDGYHVSAVPGAREALKQVERAHISVVLTDIRMEGMDGIELLRELKKRREDLPVIIMTAFASIDTAVRAFDEHAYDYIRKPYHLAELRSAVRRALDHSRLALENRELRSAREASLQIRLVGTSPPMVEIYKAIARVAKSDTTVLISGESGTGKELVANAIHQNSWRAGNPFLAINCGALTETLLEAELFGHLKGAFTGAVFSRKGVFEAAHTGTLMLDEVNETTPAMQTKLLRVLEERKVTPVGATQATPVDVRVIAAANRSLDQMVRDGRFREDLFYRLHVVEIALPPLRDRLSDLPLLFDHFLLKYTTKLNKTLSVAPGLVENLAAYDWPGNVRELENAVERAVTLNHTGMLGLEDLPTEVTRPEPRVVKGDAPLLSLDEVQAQYVRHVIARVGGNISRAAEALKIDRRTLYRMIDRYDLLKGRERLASDDV